MKKSTIHLFVSSEVYDTLKKTGYEVEIIVDNEKAGSYAVNSTIYDLVPYELRGELDDALITDLQDLLDEYEDGITEDFMSDLLEYGYAYIEGYDDKLIVFLKSKYNYNDIYNKLHEDHAEDIINDSIGFDEIVSAYMQGRDINDLIDDRVEEVIDETINYYAYPTLAMVNLQDM